MMRIKLDENLSRHLAASLTELGHDVATAAEEGLLGKDDREVGAAAAQEGRLVFSMDLDFADLRRFPPGQHPGIVVFRPRSMGPRSVLDFVMAFLRSAENQDLAGCVLVVEPGRIRIRRPPLQGTDET
jgi:predicted nuclease of predicted toxin-antitoxin system